MVAPIDPQAVLPVMWSTNLATAVADAAAPLSLEAREQQSTVHIHIHGGPDLPDIRLELDGRGVRDVEEDDNVNGD